MKRLRFLSLISVSCYVLFVVCFLFPHPASASVLSRSPNNLGLVGYWSLDDGVGTKAGDSSGSGNTGTLTNSPTWINGKHGKALSFNGSSQFITAPGNAVPDSAPMTVSYWENYNPGNTGVPIEKWTSNIDSTTFLLAEGGGYMKAAITGDVYLVSFTAPSASTWHLFTYTMDSSNNFYAYVDGVYVATGSFSFSSSINPGSPILIGGHYNPYPTITNFCDCKLDDVRIYNRALSASEVKALYQSGSAKINSSNNNKLTNGLVGLWSLDGADIGSVIFDRSGQGNNGGFFGGATTTAVVPGKIGQALSFNGTSYVGVPGSSSLDIRNSLTIGAWVMRKTNLTNGEIQYLVYNNVPGNFLYGFGQYHVDGIGDGLIFQAGGGRSTSHLIYTLSYPINTWHYIAASLDTSAHLVTMYSDGVQVYQAAESVNSWGAGSDLVSIASGLNAVADDVRIYNRVLTPAEIKQLYDMGNTPVHVNSSQNTKSTNGLVGLWSFNGKDVSWGSNTAFDRSGNGNNGTMVNMSTSTGQVVGKIGQALLFDGVDDYIDTGYSWSASDPALTISAWIKTTGSGAVERVMVGNYTSSQPCLIFETYNGKLSAYIRDSGLNTINPSSSASVNDGNWKHVAVVVGGTTATLYVNGSADGSGSHGGFNGNFSNGSVKIAIGRDSGSLSADYYDGSLDDVRIYNRALSAAEIKQLYLQGK